MLRNILLTGFLLLALSSSCMASSAETTSPMNALDAADVSKAVAPVSESTNNTDSVNITKEANSTELVSVAKSTNSTELADVSKETNKTELVNVTQAIRSLKASSPVETASNDSLNDLNNSSKTMEAAPSLATVSATSTGIASDYWIELIPYPAGSPTSLWLFVDGEWRKLDSPNDAEQSLVKAAFCDCPTSHRVKVWYQADRIVGLVATSSSL